MQAEQNELITRVGPGTACGALLRSYWQPVALLDEFDARLDAGIGARPVKPVRVLGEDLVLFRDGAGRFGLLDRPCPHRGADLAFGRCEDDGLRCPFHGWKFAVDGTCLGTPAEPVGSQLCQRVRQRSYPLQERAGVLFAWLGAEGSTPCALPAFDAFVAPAFFFLSATMWAGFTLAMRRSGLSAMAATATVCVLSGVAYLPIYILFLPHDALTAAPTEVLVTQAIYQGILTSFAALFCFSQSVIHLGSARAAVFPALIPVAATCLGAVALNEVPSVVETAGVVLISLGAWRASTAKSWSRETATSAPSRLFSTLGANR